MSGRTVVSDPAHRSIRSYVLRQGRTTAAQARAHRELAPVYGIPFGAAPLDLDRTFGRAAPKVLEIGFGMGETTAAIAAAHPEIDYLGIEVHTPGVGSLLNRIEALGLANVRVIQHDAVEVLERMIAPAALDAVHLFFPDPWPKKRHHKRRLVQAPFVSLLAARMKRGAYRARRDRLGGLRAPDPGGARRRAGAREHRGRLRPPPGVAAADQVRAARRRPRAPSVGCGIPEALAAPRAAAWSMLTA